MKKIILMLVLLAGCIDNEKYIESGKYFLTTDGTLFRIEKTWTKYVPCGVSNQGTCEKYYKCPIDKNKNCSDDNFYKYESKTEAIRDMNIYAREDKGWVGVKDEKP